MQYTLVGGIKYRKKRLKEHPSPEFTPSEVNIFVGEGVPLVKTGDIVQKGTPVGKSESGFTVFASISGEITDVENGFITIISKQQEASSELLLLPEYSGELDSESRKTLAEYLLASGHPDSDEMDIRREFENTRRIILNCLGSPRIEDAEKIIDGAKLVLLSIGVRSAVIAISKNNKYLAKAIEECKYDKEMFIIAMLPTSHPLEMPDALRTALLPYSSANDCYVLSPISCIAAYEAFAQRKPFLGHNVKLIYKRTSYTVFCPQGTTVKELKAYMMGIVVENAPALSVYTGISGIGIPLSDDTVIGNDISVLTFKKAPLSSAKYDAVCISCGKCADVCPQRLSPRLISAGFDKDSIEYCISCACCSAACPVGIPLAEKIHKMKTEAYNEN